MEREPPATHEEGSARLPLHLPPVNLSLVFMPDNKPSRSLITGSNSSVKLSERASNTRDKERERDKEKGVGEGGAAAGGGGVGKEAEKRKRSRTTDKLQSSSNPASPGGAKRRRT